MVAAHSKACHLRHSSFCVRTVWHLSDFSWKCLMHNAKACDTTWTAECEKLLPQSDGRYTPAPFPQDPKGTLFPWSAANVFLYYAGLIIQTRECWLKVKAMRLMWLDRAPLDLKKHIHHCSDKEKYFFFSFSETSGVRFQLPHAYAAYIHFCTGSIHLHKPFIKATLALSHPTYTIFTVRVHKHTSEQCMQKEVRMWRRCTVFLDVQEPNYKRRTWFLRPSERGNDWNTLPRLVRSCAGVHTCEWEVLHSHQCLWQR